MRTRAATGLDKSLVMNQISPRSGRQIGDSEESQVGNGPTDPPLKLSFCPVQVHSGMTFQFLKRSKKKKKKKKELVLYLKMLWFLKYDKFNSHF